MRAPSTLAIGELARLAGVNVETVRYYERQGLVAEPPRTASGYRVFPYDTVRRLRFIKRAQELGFSLVEIRALLSIRMRRGAANTEVRKQAEIKIAEIRTKIKTLEAMTNVLRTLTEQCDGCPPSAACPILEAPDGEASPNREDQRDAD